MNALAVKANPQAASPALRLPASIEQALSHIKATRPLWGDFPVCEPEVRKQIPVALGEVERSLTPASEEQIAAALATVSLALPTGKGLSDDEEVGRLELYIRALSDVPADILHDACMEAVKRLKFFPKVAELREFASKELARRHWTLATLRMMADVHDERYVPPSEMVSPSELGKLAKRIGSRFESKRGVA